MRGTQCILAAWFVVFAITGRADTITFKDGTTQTVRIYKTAAEYVSYLYKGKIEVVRRDKIKSIQIQGKPLTDKDLAAAIKKAREEAKTKLREEEKKLGVKPLAKAEVKDLTGGQAADKGVKVIGKGRSKTHATELMIDPFPDHPTETKKSKPGAKAGSEPKKK
jgi:hypothetical protein